MIWAQLMVTAVAAQTPTLVEDGADADALTLENGAGIDLAEIISGIADALDDWLPDTDATMLAVITRDGIRTKILSEAGLIVVRADGGLGFTLGRGQVVESIGESLAIIRTPGEGRYLRGYRLPGYKYWGK